MCIRDRPKSKVTGLKVAFDKTSYSLRTGESTEVKLTAKLTVFGSDTIVTDLPAISVNDPSIATYSNGKITGVAEGSTTLTASLYGLTAADMPTINVYRCCLLYTSPSPRDGLLSRMPSSA